MTLCRSKQKPRAVDTVSMRSLATRMHGLSIAVSLTDLGPALERRTTHCRGVRKQIGHFPRSISITASPQALSMTYPSAKGANSVTIGVGRWTRFSGDG